MPNLSGLRSLARNDSLNLRNCKFSASLIHVSYHYMKTPVSKNDYT